MKFFKNSLGFKKKEIIIVDINDFSQEIIESECATTGQNKKVYYKCKFDKST